MKFKHIQIKNFRNYEELNVDLDNRNIFFGMNDIGKTNFLYALRFIFDNTVRRNGFEETDFYQMNTDDPIVMMIAIDISDLNNSEDSKKLYSRAGRHMADGEEIVYIKLEAKYDPLELVARPEMSWGGDPDHLDDMNESRYAFEIDKIFNVFYIDSYADLDHFFKKQIRKLLNSSSVADETIQDSIKESLNGLNESISQLSSVKEFEDTLNPEFKKYRLDDVNICLRSEIAINGYFSDLTPYMTDSEDDNLYPTSGDGRKKLLIYSMYKMQSDFEESKKINLFLIEEPENHLHKSLQFSLSQNLFNKNDYKYLFVTTHSPYVLYSMENINLVRISKRNQHLYTNSHMYKVDNDFEKNRKMRNRHLAEAIFSNVVLLVEGISELILFEEILSSIAPDYEVKGLYILPVNGVAFVPYFEIFSSLNIKTIVKTDNDFKKYTQSNDNSSISKKIYKTHSFSRINKMLESKEQFSNLDRLEVKEYEENTPARRIEAYNEQAQEIEAIRSHAGIYLSKVDLENDLCEAIGEDVLSAILDVDEPIKYLQARKAINMHDFIYKLQNNSNSQDIYKKIFEHDNFKCLSEVINEIN